MSMGFAIECVSSETGVICNIDFGFDVGKVVPKLDIDFVELRDGYCVGDDVSVMILVDNTLLDDVEIEYYSYAYLGAKCLSCAGGARESNMNSVVVDTGDSEQLVGVVSLYDAGEYMVKVKYRKKGLKSWNEFRSEIIVSDCVVDDMGATGLVDMVDVGGNVSNVTIVSDGGTDVIAMKSASGDNEKNEHSFSASTDSLEDVEFGNSMVYGVVKVFAVLGCVLLSLFVFFGNKLKAKLFK